MGRTALYRDPVPFRPARADVQLDADALLVRFPDGRARRYALHGVAVSSGDGCVTVRAESHDTEHHALRVGARVERLARDARRFVRVLWLDGAHGLAALITPPDQGALVPGVVPVPEAPADAAVLDVAAWDALADWLLGGGRLAGCSIAELARLATLASTAFAGLIGEVAAQRALELGTGRGPLRGGVELEAALQPLIDAARTSPRAAEALFAAQAFAARPVRRRRA